MHALRFLFRQFREAPSKRRLLRSLALGNKRGNRTVRSADGTELSVRTSGDGPPIVFVHGVLDCMNTFAFVEPTIAERATVWVYDRRGRGGSGDHDDYSLDKEIDDLRAVIAAAGGAPHVVGHSYGAVVAMRAALDGVGMRSLVLYEPPLNGGVLTVEKIAEIERLIVDDRRDDAIRAMAKDLAGISDDELAVAMGVPPVRAALRDGTRSLVRELHAIRDADWDDLPITGTDVLVLCGERRESDVYPTAEQAADLATSVDVVTLPGQGHLAPTFTPHHFADVVAGFVAAH